MRTEATIESGSGQNRHTPDTSAHAEIPPLKSLGLGVITGAADDDPSAIGTYASAGAAFGPSFLWTAPVTMPMMISVVYLCSKLGQITGHGLTAIIREHYPRWVLFLVVAGILLGNTIEAGADIGGIAASCNLLIPIPIVWITIPATIIILSLQIFGTYRLIKTVFRWLALALFTYVGSALLARPDFALVLKDTFVPTIHFNSVFLATLVAVIGTTLSPYLYVWQVDQEVEESISRGMRSLDQRRNRTTKAALRHARWDVTIGMVFSNIIMYFIILSTAVTLFAARNHDINTAAEAAQALRPLAGNAAGLLFAVGVVGVGFLAVPVMTTGAAYALSQAMGWRHGLHFRFSEAKQFYIAIILFHALAMSINFIGLNPIRALFWAGIVQGFLAPPLMFLIMLMTNNKKIMGPWTNHPALNVLGWTSTAVVFAAAAGLVYTWIKG